MPGHPGFLILVFLDWWVSEGFGRVVPAARDLFGIWTRGNFG
jgi:hypothetical protein